MKDGTSLVLNNSSKYFINSEKYDREDFQDDTTVLNIVYAFTIALLSSNDSGNYTFSIVGQQFTSVVFILDAPRGSSSTPTETIFRIKHIR